MSAIDDYREGYEQGCRDAQDVISTAASVFGQGFAGGLSSNAYNKGLNDGREGRPFDPPDDD